MPAGARWSVRPAPGRDASTRWGCATSSMHPATAGTRTVPPAAATTARSLQAAQRAACGCKTKSRPPRPRPGRRKPKKRQGRQSGTSPPSTGSPTSGHEWAMPATPRASVMTTLPGVPACTASPPRPRTGCAASSPGSTQTVCRRPATPSACAA